MESDYLFLLFSRIFIKNKICSGFQKLLLTYQLRLREGRKAQKNLNIILIDMGEIFAKFHEIDPN